MAESVVTRLDTPTDAPSNTELKPPVDGCLPSMAISHDGDLQTTIGLPGIYYCNLLYTYVYLK